MSNWGGACSVCGHPASHHGASFCTVKVGSGPEAQRPACDCGGWNGGIGRCGDAAVQLGGSRMVATCSLRPGHAGWHREGSTEWGPSPVSAEGQQQ